MFHSATCVEALPPSTLRVDFSNGEVREYDVNAMKSVNPVFDTLLADESLFCKAHLAPGGYGILWNSDVDLSVETIYENGWPVGASTEEKPAPTNASST